MVHYYLDESATIEQVSDAYPSAAHIEPVEGGYAVFDFLTDYETWKAQV